MSARPITFIWSDVEKTMRPFGVGMLRRAIEDYGDGEIVRLAEPADRTQQAEGFFFANLKEMWSSLPEKFAEEWWAEDAEALRHYALIKTGFANTEVFSFKSTPEAKRFMVYLAPMVEHAIITREDTTVYRFTAKSQSRKAMPGRATFAESSTKVLDFVADLLKLPADAKERKAE